MYIHSYIYIFKRRALINKTALFPSKHNKNENEKRMRKVFPMKTVVDNNLFLYLRINTLHK